MNVKIETRKNLQIHYSKRVKGTKGKQVGDMVGGEIFDFPYIIPGFWFDDGQTIFADQWIMLFDNFLFKYKYWMT